MSIKAITFDIWDTIVIDKSDEEKRLKTGLPSKREERLNSIFKLVNSYSKLDMSIIEPLYTENNKWFEKLWTEEFKTPPAHDRIRRLCNMLGINPTNEEIEKTASYWQNMELDIPPQVLSDAVLVIKKLCKSYTLAIVSDAIITPGIVLRKLLKKYDILDSFMHFAFSDEVGFSKPSKEIFNFILNKLSLPAEECLHIGDRPVNDIDGAKKVGMKAFLFTGIKKRNLATFVPDAEFDNFFELPELIKKIL